jgi:hypothetical protein
LSDRQYGFTTAIFVYLIWKTRRPPDSAVTLIGVPRASRTYEKRQIFNFYFYKHNCNEDYFEKIDSCEKAYWLGLLFADGYVRKRKQFNGKHKQGGIVGISLKNGDEYLLEKLITL